MDVPAAHAAAGVPRGWLVGIGALLADEEVEEVAEGVEAAVVGVDGDVEAPFGEGVDVGVGDVDAVALGLFDEGVHEGHGL